MTHFYPQKYFVLLRLNLNLILVNDCRMLINQIIKDSDTQLSRCVINMRKLRNNLQRSELLQNQLNKKKFYAEDTLQALQQRVDNYTSLLQKMTDRFLRASDIGHHVQRAISQQMEDMVNRVTTLDKFKDSFLTMVPHSLTENGVCDSDSS